MEYLLGVVAILGGVVAILNKRNKDLKSELKNRDVMEDVSRLKEEVASNSAELAKEERKRVEIQNDSSNPSIDDVIELFKRLGK